MVLLHHMDDIIIFTEKVKGSYKPLLRFRWNDLPLVMSPESKRVIQSSIETAVFLLCYYRREDLNLIQRLLHKPCILGQISMKSYFENYLLLELKSPFSPKDFVFIPQK